MTFITLVDNFNNFIGNSPTRMPDVMSELFKFQSFTYVTYKFTFDIKESSCLHVGTYSIKKIDVFLTVPLVVICLMLYTIFTVKSLKMIYT